ncbi:dual specificity protein kinase CLK1 isoform X2 [Kryptolebias marmoratus]|uniref:dual specificity protein kinase CLK1 isoform X2 n=1 Tax=Kryptolebias marmoratus TaxID=37003 RepID=UPI0007F92386|nr:dual specificity protein kinase CLK1 isoform X2 [Kryptolebias marmoratus]
MGKKNAGWDSRKGGEESKTDRDSETKSGSFMHRTQRPTLETSESSKDSTLQTKEISPEADAVAAADGLKTSSRRDVPEDDEDGHLNYHAGLLMKQRYQVVSTLGAGAFGKVVECIDRQTDERVAVKIGKKLESFCEVARSEISVLEEMNSLDDDNRFACVRMLDWFQHEGHVCIVLELLGRSTFDFLPFSVQQIRLVAFQVFRAVSFLHRNKVTHTDLKPENILFVRSDCDPDRNHQTKSPSSWSVKVVDFGSATFDHQHHQSLVSTRHYRAPEVILGLGWDQSCDVWSLGCVLMEYYLGRTLFPSHDSREHLAMMEKVSGCVSMFGFRNQHLVKNWDGPSSSDKLIRSHCQPLKTYMRTSGEDERQLFELLAVMLEYDVSRRITLEEALWHRFFNPLRNKRSSANS